MTDTAVRDLFISSVHKYAADGESSQPLGDWYETLDGTVEGFRARPVVGGHLAHVCSLTVLFPSGHGADCFQRTARFDVNGGKSALSAA